MAAQHEALEKKKLNAVETKKEELKPPEKSENDMELEIPIHQIQKQPVTVYFVHVRVPAILHFPRFRLCYYFLYLV